MAQQSNGSGLFIGAFLLDLKELFCYASRRGLKLVERAKLGEVVEDSNEPKINKPSVRKLFSLP